MATSLHSEYKNGALLYYQTHRHRIVGAICDNLQFYDFQHENAQVSGTDPLGYTATVVEAGSGTTEITMRGDDGTFLWNVYQPTQVIELIHQLASNVGCHIHIQPRKDFASWREWQEVDEEENLKLNGFPPFAGQNLEYKKTDLLDSKTNQVVEKDNVATKKAVNKRASKRSRAATR